MIKLRERWQAWQPTNRQVWKVAKDVAKFMVVLPVMSRLDNLWAKILWALVLLLILDEVDGAIEEWVRKRRR